MIAYLHFFYFFVNNFFFKSNFFLIYKYFIYKTDKNRLI